MIVLKLGGTSVGTPEAMSRCAEICHCHGGERQLVVVSALAGVTDQLVALADAATAGNHVMTSDIMTRLCRRHHAQASALLPEPATADFIQSLERLLRALSGHAADLTTGRNRGAARDGVLAFGERAAAELFARLLAQLGLSAVFRDARELLITDDRFGRARPLEAPTRDRLVETVVPALSTGHIVVTQGFAGATRDGRTTTLGRGGSDYSATLFGALLDAREVQILTDVDGVYSADPKLIPAAVPVPRLNLEDAWELSHYGAEVLYPPCLEPLRDAAIPLYVRTSRGSSTGGTLISRTISPDPARFFVSLIPNGRLLHLVPRAGSDLSSSLLAAAGEHLSRVDAVSIREIETVLLTAEPCTHFLDALKGQLATTRVEEVATVHLIGGEPARRLQLQRECHHLLAEARIPIRYGSSMGKGKHALFAVPAERGREASRLLHRRFCEAVGAPVAEEVAP